MRTLLSTFVEVLGLAAAVIGAYLICLGLGVLVSGVVLVLAGLALDPPRRSQ